MHAWNPPFQTPQRRFKRKGYLNKLMENRKSKTLVLALFKSDFDALCLEQLPAQVSHEKGEKKRIQSCVNLVVEEETMNYEPEKPSSHRQRSALEARLFPPWLIQLARMLPLLILWP